MIMNKTMTVMNVEYNITLRELNNYESIMNEIEKLDLFNHPNEFSEMNDQLYEQYHLRVELADDPRVPSAKSFNIKNDFGDVVVKSEYSYGFANEAKVEGLVTIAKYVRENKLTSIEISNIDIEDSIRLYRKFYCKLPAYIKRVIK